MLIAGVGNIFLGDDGFGVEVANRLTSEGLPGWVRVADYGISGMHLAYDLAEGFETTILVDATPRGGDPGTVYVMELDPATPSAAAAPEPEPGRGIPLLDGHGMQPDVVFGMLDILGAEAGRVLLVGCEPASIDERIGLSEPVAAAVDEAVRIVLDLVRGVGVGDAARSVAEGGRPADACSQLSQGDSVSPGEANSPVEADRQPAAGNSRR
jgi:hydrogenase maturation protease